MLAPELGIQVQKHGPADSVLSGSSVQEHLLRAVREIDGPPGYEAADGKVISYYSRVFWPQQFHSEPLARTAALECDQLVVRVLSLQVKVELTRH